MSDELKALEERKSELEFNHAFKQALKEMTEFSEGNSEALKRICKRQGSATKKDILKTYRQLKERLNVKSHDLF